jgi:hypothetical protein
MTKLFAMMGIAYGIHRTTVQNSTLGTTCLRNCELGKNDEYPTVDLPYRAGQHVSSASHVQIREKPPFRPAGQISYLHRKGSHHFHNGNDIIARN